MVKKIKVEKLELPETNLDVNEDGDIVLKIFYICKISYDNR